MGCPTRAPNLLQETDERREAQSAQRHIRWIEAMASLNSRQRALAASMFEISVAAYCAGWMQDLEQSLWRAVVEGPRRYGRMDLTEQGVAELRRLCAAC
jgi:hypothetical protein